MKEKIQSEEEETGNEYEIENTDNEDENDSNDDDEDNDINITIDQSVIKTEEENEKKENSDAKHPRRVSNDVSEGRTVFLKNVPFSVKNDELKSFMEQFGPIYYALVCIDPLTEYSKGTAFVKFRVRFTNLSLLFFFFFYNKYMINFYCRTLKMLKSVCWLELSYVYVIK